MPKKKITKCDDKIIKCDDFPNDFNLCANSKKYTRLDINIIAKDCDIEKPSGIKNRNLVCEAILRKKYGDKAAIPSSDVNCEMTLGKCKAQTRDVLDKLAPECGIDPKKYKNKNLLCDAIIEKQIGSISPEEKIRHKKLEEIEKTKKANKIAGEIIRDSESEFNDDSESDLDSENNDDKVLTDKIIKKELRNIGSYNQLVDNFLTRKGIINALLSILQEKYDIVEFTYEQKNIIKNEIKIMKDEELLDSDSESESESKSESKPDNKIKEIKEIEKDLESMGKYNNRSGITKDELKKLSDKYDCGIKKSLNKEEFFNKTKTCLNEKLKKLKSGKNVKTSKSTTVEDMEKIKETEELAKKEKALKESLKSNKELKISKKSTKSVEDLIVESIRELGPFSTIFKEYFDEDGDIDYIKFKQKLKIKLDEKTTEKILLKDYKKVIDETLADMKKKEQYIINKSESERESEGESDTESVGESEGESDAESVRESKTKPLEVDETPLPTTILEIEESDKSKIRKEFEEQWRVRKKRKKSLSSIPFKELKKMITSQPESELRTCDPINNRFCSDNFTCDISQEPNICIENKNVTGIEDIYSYERYTYNGKEIIGPKNLIESLKNKLESKKELTESLIKNDSRKPYISFRYRNLKKGQNYVIVVNKETGIIDFVWNIVKYTTYDTENPQFLIQTKILQEKENKNEAIIKLKDAIEIEGDNIYASLYIDPNKLFVSESDDIKNILLAMTLAYYDENIINKYINNIDESTVDDLANTKVILTEDLKFKFDYYGDEKDIYDEEDNDTDDEDNSVDENISGDDDKTVIEEDENEDENEDETVINDKDNIDSMLEKLVVASEEDLRNLNINKINNKILGCLGLI